MKRLLIVVACGLMTLPVIADVALTDHVSALNRIVQSSALSAEQQEAIHASNRAKNEVKQGVGRPKATTNGFHASPTATGSVALIDAAGLKYFVNTNITFTTTKSASGAASEASYTANIAASTSAGGSVSMGLNDMFDGYNGLCVSLTGATGPCANNASYVSYNKNGAAVADASVPAVAYCTNRQYVFPAQTIGPLSVRRKVYVPTNDRYIRWANIFTNTSGAAVTFNAIIANNLGSDGNTIVVNSSNGDAVAQTSDTWISSFQNWSSGASSDPRIGHVLQGLGATTPVSNIFFANGNDKPYWTYSITLQPGQTKIIVNFATGMGTKAAAATQAANLASWGSNAQQCLSPTELTQVSNFSALSAAAIPAMNMRMLALLGAALAFAAIVIIGKRF